MLSSGFYVILLVQVFKITADQCLTPNNEQGNCISLYSCPRLIQLLQKQPKDGDEFVRKSRCGTTPTEPLVCCPSEPKEPPGSCTTPNKQEGKCTSLSSCPELLKLLESQQTDSIEYVRKSGCQITDSKVSVCCPTTNSANDDKQIIINDNDRSTNVKIQEQRFFPSRSYCGFQHSDEYEKNVKGADISDFPWLAGLKYKFKSGDLRVSCHGSIINQRYILTGAHCIQATTGVTLESIRLGEYNIRNETDCVEYDGFVECSEPVIELGVEEVVIHPEYTLRPHIKADIALIRLNASITYSDYIRPICLPLPGTRSPQLGDTMVTSGWGKSDTAVKKKVLNRYITNDDCTAMFRKVVRSFSITPAHICTLELSDNTEFSCAGDSGGPLMFSHKSQWYLEGITSFGSKICGDEYPVIHTQVSKYIDWIRDSMKPW